MVICKKSKKHRKGSMHSLEDKEEKLFKTYEYEIRKYAEIHREDLLELDATRDIEALSKKYYEMERMAQEIRAKAPWAISPKIEKQMEELARGWILLKKGIEIVRGDAD